MADQITNLIELAMSSNSDAEKLAALAQAKRIYKNDGITLPKRVARAVPVAPVAPVVNTYAVERDGLIKDVARINKDNDRLGAENTALRTQILNDGRDTEAAMTSIEGKVKNLAFHVTIGYGLSFVLAVILVAVSL